ncbi:hypothetical protein Igag_1071 [Ignisphaera aggregans DSM 17230]|uniref:Uncharacterized protein n=1 Tax=Ignisphaera aggregans (strain DSM 17230 / JCM 13409 / AQ1.S1) TaxID=583356 RepID=E0SNT9_IGNAA|nr:hypothetical protein Igag_1071 [Ignisphaera aggregans DSM 17230]
MEKTVREVIPTTIVERYTETETKTVTITPQSITVYTTVERTKIFTEATTFLRNTTISIPYVLPYTTTATQLRYIVVGYTSTTTNTVFSTQTITTTITRRTYDNMVYSIGFPMAIAITYSSAMFIAMLIGIYRRHLRRRIALWNMRIKNISMAIMVYLNRFWTKIKVLIQRITKIFHHLVYRL